MTEGVASLWRFLCRNVVRGSCKSDGVPSSSVTAGCQSGPHSIFEAQACAKAGRERVFLVAAPRYDNPFMRILQEARGRAVM